MNVFPEFWTAYPQTNKQFFQTSSLQLRLQPALEMWQYYNGCQESKNNSEKFQEDSNVAWIKYMKKKKKSIEQIKKK